MGKPKIRFKGYEDAWEQRKVSELLQERNEQAPMSEEYPLMAFIANQGVAPKGDRYDRSALVNDETGKKYKRTEFGDFIYSSNNLETGSIGLNKYGNACISPVYSIFKPTGKADLDFLGRRFLRKDFINEMVKWRQGVVYGQWKIHETDFLNIVVTVPTIEEQKRIGDFLDGLDSLITLHQRKCYRFIDIALDAWEQRKLDGWGTFYYGRSCPKWSVTEDATIPCIRYGELYTKFGAKIDRVYSYTNMPPENLRFSKGTEVLIPRVGEDPMDYNHCTWLSMPDVAIGEMISVFNTDNNPLFTATMFNATLQNEFAMRVEGGSVTNLYFEKLKNIEVSFPSIQEQEKIAAYFENLDHLITLHQRKCEETKSLKKYMLQKMFPENGKCVPEIRFSGFSDAWEQRKLEEYLGVSKEKNRDESFGKDDVLSVSGEYGIVNQIEFQGRSFAGASVANYGVVEGGDVVYTKSPLKSNPYGIIKTNKGKTGIVSTLYAVYKPKNNVGAEFVQIYFELDSRMNSYMHPLVNKGAKNDMKVSDENALKGSVIFPKIDEQKAISKYFAHLDHLITLHQHKCDELQKLKKFMLQNMFV